MTAPDDMNANTANATASGQSATPPLPADALPPDALIVLPTRNLVLFPEMVFPLAMGRPATVAAAQQAVRDQRQVLVVLQRDPEKSEVVPGDLHQIGTVANILRYVTAPDGTHHVDLPGRAALPHHRLRRGPSVPAGARPAPVVEPSGTSPGAGPEIEARFLVLQQPGPRRVMDLLPQVPPELRQTVEAH